MYVYRGAAGDRNKGPGGKRKRKGRMGRRGRGRRILRQRRR